MKDNRINSITGTVSNMNDIDEVFRDICSHFGASITKMKTFTKSNTVVNMRSLLLLSTHMNLKLTVDPALDKFEILYHDKDQLPIENPIVELAQEDSLEEDHKPDNEFVDIGLIEEEEEDKDPGEMF